MAKTSKKAIGTAMAGVMAVGAVAGAVQSVNVANAAESAALKEAKANVDHLINSINKNYAGIKNQSTWELYVKTIKSLIAKIPSAEKAQAAELTKKTDAIADVVVAIGNINNVEKSIETNYNGIKNAATWNGYLEVALEKMKSVDKSVFQAKYDELVERYNKVDAKVEAIIEKHNADLAAAEALYQAAVASNKLEDAQKALAAAEALGTHSTSDALEAKVNALIAQINAVPAVTSVGAINATQVEVKFNKAVTKETAEGSTSGSITTANLAKYTIGSANPTEVSLSKDGRTATLTFAASVEGNSKTVVIEPFTTAEDQTKETAKYTSLLSFKDTTKPTVKAVTAQTGSATVGTVEVEFSEPVVTGSTFKVNGKAVAVANVGSLTSNGTKVELSGLALTPGSANTLEVIGLTDKANEANITVSQTVNFTAEANTVLPKATVSTVSDKFIDITFDKKMNDTTVIASNIKLAEEDGTTIIPSAVSLHPDDEGNKTKFRVTLPNLYASKDSRSVTLTLTNGIVDSLGNKLAPVSTTVSLSKDTTKPVVSSTQFVKNPDGYVTKVILNYSEELSAVAADLTGVQVVDANGRLNTSVLNSATITAVSAGDKKVEINVPAANKVEAGSYSIVLPKDFVTDNAHGSNKSNAQTVTVNFGTAAEAFVIPASNITSTAATNVIKVDFGQAVKGGSVAGSATDRNNYKLDGKVLPEGTSIVLNAAGTEATITLPSKNSVKVTGATPFAVEGVKNSNNVTNTTVAKAVNLTDNTAPELTKVTFDSYDATTLGSEVATFTLEFDEAVKAYASDTAITNEIALKVDGQTVTLSAATVTVKSVAGFDNKYTLTINDLAIDTIKPVTITTVAKSSSPVITDKEGNDKKDKVSFTVTK